MYKELEVSSDVPATKLHRAFKRGTLSLSASELKGSGATLHLHPETYNKAVKACRLGKGTRLQVTHKEIGYPFKHLQGAGLYGASIWSKIWKGVKRAFKWAKDSGVLSRVADAAVPAIAAYTGNPAAAASARGGLKTLTGIGVDGEGAGTSMATVKKRGKQAIKYMKYRGIITDAVDELEKLAISRAPAHTSMIKEARGEIKKLYGVGLGGVAVKGSEEAKARMALVRAARGKKGGSFRM